MKIYIYEDKICWYNSKDCLHRVDGPAVVYSDGLQQWWLDDFCWHIRNQKQLDEDAQRVLHDNRWNLYTNG